MCFPSLWRNSRLISTVKGRDSFTTAMCSPPPPPGSHTWWSSLLPQMLRIHFQGKFKFNRVWVDICYMNGGEIQRPGEEIISFCPYWLKWGGILKAPGGHFVKHKNEHLNISTSGEAAAGLCRLVTWFVCRRSSSQLWKSSQAFHQHWLQSLVSLIFALQLLNNSHIWRVCQRMFTCALVSPYSSTSGETSAFALFTSCTSG